MKNCTEKAASVLLSPWLISGAEWGVTCPLYNSHLPLFSSCHSTDQERAALSALSGSSVSQPPAALQVTLPACSLLPCLLFKSTPGMRCSSLKRHLILLIRSLLKTSKEPHLRLLSNTDYKSDRLWRIIIYAPPEWIQLNSGPFC